MFSVPIVTVFAILLLAAAYVLKTILKFQKGKFLIIPELGIRRTQKGPRVTLSRDRMTAFMTELWPIEKFSSSALNYELSACGFRLLNGSEARRFLKQHIKNPDLENFIIIILDSELAKGEKNVEYLHWKNGRAHASSHSHDDLRHDLGVKKILGSSLSDEYFVAVTKNRKGMGLNFLQWIYFVFLNIQARIPKRFSFLKTLKI
jgi:hypothetical protein